jgi:hypothetical protein
MGQLFTLVGNIMGRTESDRNLSCIRKPCEWRRLVKTAKTPRKENVLVFSIQLDESYHRLVFRGDNPQIFRKSKKTYKLMIWQWMLPIYSAEPLLVIHVIVV